MQGNTSSRVFVIFSIVMLVAMVGSVLLPLLLQNVQNPTTQLDSTDVPEPTLPPMPDDFSVIGFDDIVMHNSGLFTVARPTGWNVSNQSNNGFEVKLSMNNAIYQSVVEASIDIAPTAIETVNDVEARLTPSLLGDSWRQYTSWDETRRVIEDDRVVIDFTLTAGQRSLIARQISWTDGEWMYSVRVVAPENGANLLRYLLDGTIASLEVNRELASTPTGWNAYFDTETRHILRLPPTWALTDAAPGLPASFEGTLAETNENVLLRVETVDGQIADTAAASTWVENSRSSGIAIEDVVNVQQGGMSGFSVSYTYTDLDGEQQSGIAVLLNGPDDRFHVANLRLDVAGVDLNSDDGRETYPEIAQVMDSFRVMPDLEVAGA